MPAVTLPITLAPPLSDREAVLDAMYRALNGLDSNNKEVFSSAFVPESKFGFNETLYDGFEAIQTKVFDMIGRMDTAHIVSTPRVHIESGGDVAHITASAMAQHFRPGTGHESGAPHFLGGSLYAIDLRKDCNDGLWKIVHWHVGTTWSMGDFSVMSGN